MGVLTWDEYFMSVAVLSTKRSKDPNTQVGACIVDEKKRIVGVGYNGMPGGDDTSFSWERDGEYLDTKYPYVVHAEQNAVLNSISNLDNCTMYVTLFPCSSCAKTIVQSGIKKLVYLDDKYSDTPDNMASKHILSTLGVELESYKGDRSIVLDLSEV